MTEQEWLDWRKKGLGGSEVAVLHGFYKYQTPLDLFEEKSAEGPAIVRPANFIQAKGHNLEASARMRFSDILSNKFFQDVKLLPDCQELNALPFMRMSSDGFAIVNDKRINAEVKFMGKQRHENVINEALPITGKDFEDTECRVPLEYWIQMQHQYLVGAIDENYFVSTVATDEPIRSVLVPRDDSFLEKHIQVCTEFWLKVKSKTPPEITDADFKRLKKKGALGLAKKYAKLDEKEKLAKKEKDAIKKELIALCDHNRMECGPLKIQKQSTQGRVDYDSIPELESVDLDKYRGPSSESWVLRITKVSKDKSPTS